MSRRALRILFLVVMEEGMRRGRDWISLGVGWRGRGERAKGLKLTGEKLGLIVSY